MRADARRNYERILAAAAETVARDGAAASLEEIARAARVGSATLYRHFPTREALLNVVFHDRVESLSEQARSLAGEPDPGAGLITWLRALGAYASSTRGLPASLLQPSPAASCHALLAGAGGELLGRAQAAGAVRPDVGIDDLITLVTAISLAGEHVRTAETETDRLVRLAIDGIRPPADTPRPGRRTSGPKTSG